jgi:hypothetical protein
MAQTETALTEQFLGITTKTTAVMRAMILGPDFVSRKYTGTKADVAVGSYTGAQLATAWPGIQSGETVDLGFTRVYIDDAAQRYYNSSSGTVTVDATLKNRIRSPSIVWATKDAYTRSGTVPTDVVVGDWCRVTGVGGTITAGVIDLVGEPIAATVDTTPNASSTNKTTAAGSSSVSTVAGIGTVVASLAGITNADTYNGGPQGLVGDTYTIECTTAANATGNLGTWVGTVLKVYSLSGLDGTSAAPYTITVDGTSVTYASLAAGVAIGTLGATLKLTHGVSGDDWTVGTKIDLVVAQAYTIPATVAAGTYTGAEDTTYRLTVTKGGYFGSAAVPGGRQRAEVTIVTTTGAGIDGAVVRQVTSGSAFALGTYGVTATFTSAGAGLDDLILNDSWTIPVTAGTAANADITGALQTLVLDRDLSTLSGSLTVELAIKENLEIPQNRAGHAPTVNWTAAASTITLESGIISTDPRTSTLELDVVDGDAYVSYRALRSAYANSPQEIQTEEDIVALALPDDDVDNEMAYALRRAITDIGGSTVRFTTVATNDLAGYQAALQVLVDREDFYNIVPLTTDPEIIDAVVAAVDARKTAQTWAGAFVARTIATELEIVKLRSGGGISTATIADDPLASGTQYTLISDASGTFITSGVAAGDILRTLYVGDGFGNETYTSYTVASVESNQVLRLVSGPALPYGVATRYEIWRNRTPAQQVAAFDAQASQYSRSNVKVVFPWTVTRNGVSVPAYHLAAALAGRRAASAPHQGLRNLVLSDWDDMSQSKVTFAGLLSQSAMSHCFTVTQLPSGEVIVKFAHTSAGGDVITREDSVQNNLDSVNWFYRNLLNELRGRTNVVESNLSKIRGLVTTATNYLRSTSTTPELGPQVIEATVISIEQDVVLRDQVNVIMAAKLPAPLNTFVQTIAITV